MSRKNILITLGVVIAGAAVVGANLYFKRDKGVSVTTETIRTRDLEAIVSASGKIQPKRSVNISSDTVGRVVNLMVNEGDRVKAGQFLLQIDPKSLQARVDQETASLSANEASLGQMQQSIETGKAQLELLRQTLARQQDLWKQQLTPRDQLDKAINDVKVAESTLAEREKSVASQVSRIAQERATLDSAQYDLSRVRIASPIDGIVTKRTIEEGEMVVVGTMNNAGTVLMTLADMSIIQAEVEVDETNIPSVRLGQPAKISIDAIPDKTFKGHVTEIGNSPIQAAGQTTSSTSTTQATNFKVVVMLDEPVPEVRPGFTCTADITTATRKGVAAVPIPSVAVRELTYDANGQVIREPQDNKRRRRNSGGSVVDPVASAAELKPGETRKETDGVFVVRDKSKNVEFVPIKLGIAGDKYFEIVSGLKPGDQVVTGPYNSVRNIADGDAVKVDNSRQNSGANR
ncbi:MAG TPA: efflux RND transporter periplasmic adaptor subunit [Vicinamibacterales bacterium]|nr:efflux RND transporter periplasmic adaptor subunit [Vicinamibacterales bacterium]